ncbi:MAG: PIN domain-containing protein [Flavobacteriales bacterium]|nr:PIN domain-containing protein [Flavobacteriales bacterium]
MKRVYLDTNVCLDFLTERKPDFFFAEQIMALGDTSKIKLFVSSLSFTTIIYVAIKQMQRDKVVRLIKDFLEMICIVEADENLIKESLDSGWKDLEDAMQNESALRCKADILVTSNVRDYSKSGISIQTPEDFINNY